MKILDRYILRAFFTNYLIALVVMIGLYVLLDLVVNLDEFTKLSGEGASVGIGRTIVNIINFYGYNVFYYFAQLSGVVVLAAACFTLGRLHRTNEFTAVLASGTSLYRVAAPIVLAALGLNALWFVDQEQIIPRIAHKLARKHDDIEAKKTYAVTLQRDRENTAVYAAMFSPRMGRMRGVVIIKRDDQSRMNEVLRADEAVWDEERQIWKLEKGYVMRFASDSGEIDAAALGQQKVEEYASDLTPKELALQQASQWTTFVSLPELTALQQRFPGMSDLIKAKHVRLTTIPIDVILLLLGVPFFLNRERPSVLVAGGWCLLLCGSCFIITFLCQSVDLVSWGSNPALPAWIPVLLFSPVVVFLLDSVKT